MFQAEAEWWKYELSADQTHHLLDGKPVYSKKFLSALKFHAPGFAAVCDESGAFHIDIQGEPVYATRFLKTFGFYEERAAVQTGEGWFHIHTDGTQVYSQRFAWCGNFQEGYCTVKNSQGAFFYIDREGERVFSELYTYAGDFRDGIAVVQDREGFLTHITKRGTSLHGKKLLDLDVYHKGFARAKDQTGWFHMNLLGEALYQDRYQSVEPFYNGVSRIETFEGALLLISEQGKTLGTLRGPLKDAFHDVSAECVSYWRFYTLQSACELALFDHLPNSLDTLSQLLDLPIPSTMKLLRGLQEMQFLRSERGVWECTPRGAFLQAKHPRSLKKACRLWSQEHFTCWQKITQSLKTGLPIFPQLYGKGWFEWLEEHPEKQQLYHDVLETYAQHDYQRVCQCIDFHKHRSLLDVGGSLGALLIKILEKVPHLEGTLLDLPRVIDRVKIPFHLKSRLTCVPLDFFTDWPAIQVDGILLSRILHDWPKAEAIQILKHAHKLLSTQQGSKLYVIENIQDENKLSGSLLDLNMQIMTGGVERTLGEFEELFSKAGFTLEQTQPLNLVASLLIAGV